MTSLTIFTPTFNRGYIINKLYESLQAQTDQEFQWLVIDDGSTDNTEQYFSNIVEIHKGKFGIDYMKIENGGKQRAINKAVEVATGDYLFIVDSDDYLTDDAVEKVKKWIEEIDKNDIFAGVSGIRAKSNRKPIGGEPNFKSEHIDATNLERKQYNLQADMAEVYKKSVLKKYPFKVWPGEKFVPEATVWNAIALDGYKLRWHKDVIYICEYLEDGLTKGSWNLLKKNPMGYVMLFDQQMSYTQSIVDNFKIAVQMTANIVLAGEWKYLFKTSKKVVTFLALPVGILLSFRRRKQFKGI